MPGSVLMLGPGQGIGGGISALVGTFVPALSQRVDLIYLPTVENRPLRQSGRLSVQNVARAGSQYARFARVLAGRHPDIVHVHTSQRIAWLKDTFYVLAAKACGRRVVLHMHGGLFVDLYQQAPGVIRSYTRAVLGLADVVVGVSATLSGRLAMIAPHARICTLRNCIDLDAIRPQWEQRDAGVPRAVFLGVVGPSKGTFDLLRALARVKAEGTALCLRVAGPEERQGDMARAQAQAQALGLQDACEFLGEVDAAAKAALLGTANLLVLPSYSEALPMVVLEAMAAGLPVVASPVGGIPEVVRDGDNGFLVPPGDVTGLADKMTILAKDGGLRIAMGQRGRAAAERELGVELYVERLVRLYASIR